ncbi:MAG: hypothetical protein KF860_16190 [Cyclobacteriaceae bacterium]|nr:hypothetical protein [Cyclobacteriaceae bacterium]
MFSQFLSIFLGLLSLVILPATAQLVQGGFLAPGDSLKKLFPHERNIYLPGGGFTFYEGAHGEFKGKILPGPPLNSLESDIDTLLTSTLMGVNIRPQLLSIDTYFETSNERYYLTFDRQQEGYVRVLSDSYPGWVSLDEIRTKGFILISWVDFYGKSKGNQIHPIDKVAPVRMSPNTKASIIETADELYSEITTLGTCNGSFCKVEVVRYNNPYDPTKPKEKNISKKYKGWIQIIDEMGQPLVALNDHAE